MKITFLLTIPTADLKQHAACMYIFTILLNVKTEFRNSPAALRQVTCHAMMWHAQGLQPACRIAIGYGMCCPVLCPRKGAMRLGAVNKVSDRSSFVHELG